MIDRQQHDYQLKQLLRKIVSEPTLNNKLILKGGTCLYLFYHLKRFSVDLDFNLKENASFDPAPLTHILKTQLVIEDYYEKKFTWFWLGSYEKGKQKIKIEISKRQFPDTYEVKSFYGLSIPTMAPAAMFAHKLCAISDRNRLQNRDLYDAHFMFLQKFEIDKAIIQLRMKKSVPEYLDDLIIFIKKNVHPATILAGLGELLDASSKNWVKQHLISELLFQIQIRREFYTKMQQR